jgi:hypothetical protein
MIKKTTVLLALLTPGLALLGACASEGTTADTTAPATSSSTAAQTGTSTDTTASGMGATTSGSSTTSTGTMGSMGMGGSASFSELDKNHDGSLTRDELSSSSSIVSQFSTYDTNGDGKLSETEYNAAIGNPSSPK